MRLWSRALDDAEIAARLHRRATGAEPGLFGCWPLSEGKGAEAKNIVAMRPVGLAGVPAAAAPTGPGVRSVLELSGRRSQVEAPCKVPLTDCTIEMRVRGNPPEGGLFTAIATRGGHDRSIYLSGGNLHARLWTRSKGDEVISAPATLLGGSAWHHVAWTFGAARGGQQLFVDGVLRAQGKLTASEFDWQDRVRIGAVHEVRAPFKGAVADVRIWNRVASEQDVKSWIAQELRGAAPDLVVWWPLDSMSGTRAADSGRTGSLHGTVTEGKWVRDEEYPLQSAGVAAEGKLARFADKRSRASVPHSVVFSPTREDDFTLEAWIAVNPRLKPPEKGRIGLITKRAETGAYPLSVELAPRTGRVVCLRSDGSNRSRLEGRRSIADGALHHVAFVKSGANLLLYVDGEEDARTADEVTGRVQNVADLIIGALPKGEGAFTGHVSEVRLWAGPRSADAIRADHARRLSGEEAGLIAYWPLDDRAKPLGRDGLVRKPAEIRGPEWVKQSDLPLLPAELKEAPSVPAVAFRGGGHHVAIGGARKLGFPKGFAVEAWVQAERHGQIWKAPIVSAHGPATGWELRCSGDAASMMVTVNRHHHEAQTGGLEPGRWVHLAGVYDGSTVQLYVNGVLEASEAIAGTLTVYPGPLLFGQNSYWKARSFAGVVADVRLWERPRSGTEIHRDVYRRLPEDARDGLLAYWRLDEGQGRVAGDSHGRLPGNLAGAEWVQADLPPRLPAIAREVVTEVADEPSPEPVLASAAELQKRVVELEAQVATAKRGMAMYAARLARLSALEKSHTALEKALAEERARTADLDEMVTSQREKSGAVTLANFIRNTNREIEDARKELAARGGAYRLGPVNMELQWVPAPGGQGVIFPSMKEIGTLGEGKLSKIDINFETERPPEAEPPEDVQVPAVVGKTETLARRKLAEAGFLVTTDLQAVDSEAAGIDMEGRVVTQLPPPGVAAPPNSTVRIFIGRTS